MLLCVLWSASLAIAVVALLLYRCRCYIMNPQPYFVAYKPNLSLDNEEVSHVSALQGQTIEAVKKQLGPPTTERELGMDDVNDPFRRELLNYYPPDHPENQCVRFKELWWKGGRETTTVWFHRVNDLWVVLDACRWKRGIAF